MDERPANQRRVQSTSQDQRERTTVDVSAPRRDPGTSSRAPSDREAHVELAPIHDFAAKLCQPEILPQLKAYVRWQVGVRGASPDAPGVPIVPDFAPVSINLDLTTACNYACDHCVDMDILNVGTRFDHEELLDSLRVMADRGLRSVVLIGGGEPTVYPRFTQTIHFMKALGLQIAIVTNGSRMQRIAEVVDCFDEQDWVRLSLDAGSDELFQAMHKPREEITLDQICADVPPLKRMNGRPKIGYSFIISWKGALINNIDILENLHEIVPAAARARDFCFDYIAFKPFLTRARANNAEIVDLDAADEYFNETIDRIRTEVTTAKKLESATFRVYETTNLKMLLNRSADRYTRQPHQCHMQFFRQVLSPLGVFNCPVYRNQPHGRLGSKQAYGDVARYEATRRSTAAMIRDFDAAKECREVACLYNHANWWVEELITHPEQLNELEARPDEPDYFL